jgi:hypothetical protein
LRPSKRLTIQCIQYPHQETTEGESERDNKEQQYESRGALQLKLHNPDGIEDCPRTKLRSLQVPRKVRLSHTTENEVRCGKQLTSKHCLAQGLTHYTEAKGYYEKEEE